MLLHLIEEHELNVMDIPIAFVAKKYVEYITLMEELNIDVASEYLVMAATLTHIKSKMLLPVVPTDQEGRSRGGARPARGAGAALARVSEIQARRRTALG